MWCPVCHGEFREGFVFCELCGVKLVDEIPSEPSEVVERFAVLLELGDEAKTVIIRGFLQAEGIETWLENRTFHMQPLPAVKSFSWVRIWVLKEDLDKGRKLLREKGEIKECPTCGVYYHFSFDECPKCKE